MLTAMTTVIADNGYINYVDNGVDDFSSPERDYMLYDFYSFDIGKPTSGFVAVKAEAGFRRFESGFVAYNINSSEFKIEHLGVEIIVPPKSGLFCKESGVAFDCLKVD